VRGASSRSEDGGSLRFLVAAFGDPGHAYPALSLARALRRRGHVVALESWERWREAAEDEDLRFCPAESYRVFGRNPDGPSAGDAALALLPLLRELRPHAVVSDILTLAPALAAEREGVPWATLIPHVFPQHAPGLPFFALGARPPRTPVGRGVWRAALPLLEAGLRRGRRELNVERAKLGLPPLERLHGGTSDQLALVATFPQLEYPRAWPAHVHVTGPMQFERPYPDVALPEGEGPLVLVAPSTAQDPGCRLARVALRALANLPVRVVATTNGHRPSQPLEVPPNALLYDWVRYSQVMAAADVVVCHGGHGTLARSLALGTPVVCVPAAGEMAENAARAAWAGVGVSLPWRLLGERSLALAVRRVLGDPRFAERARTIAAWAERNDGAERAAELVERFARGAAR
jgi:UDP:flavonoid glycosyltransferase YjiC (YdhE family)